MNVYLRSEYFYMLVWEPALTFLFMKYVYTIYYTPLTWNNFIIRNAEPMHGGDGALSYLGAVRYDTISIGWMQIIVDFFLTVF
jgi:hypothetical protein